MEVSKIEKMLEVLLSKEILTTKERGNEMKTKSKEKVEREDVKKAKVVA